MFCDACVQCVTVLYYYVYVLFMLWYVDIFNHSSVKEKKEVYTITMMMMMC